MKALKLLSKDQYCLSVYLFEPQNSNNKIILINSATGVKQQIYFSFAKYFSEQGFTVLTYDYRGIGESKPPKMKNFNSSMRIWGTEDFKILTEFIKEKYPHYQKFCIGHSVGALILGMNEDSKIFNKFIFLATQDAFIGNLNFRVGLTAALGFGLALPITTLFMGYFPASWFGLGESLPKGSAFDWRTLILNKKSTSRLFEKIDKEYSKELTQEAFIIHAEDDNWVTEKGMKSLMNTAYPNMKRKYRKIMISESDKKEIGHINFFRSYNKSLWKIVYDELK